MFKSQSQIMYFLKPLQSINMRVKGKEIIIHLAGRYSLLLTDIMLTLSYHTLSGAREWKFLFPALKLLASKTFSIYQLGTNFHKYTISLSNASLLSLP